MTADWIGFAGVAVGAVAFITALVALQVERLRRQSLQADVERLEKSLSDLRQELSTVSFGALGVGQRLKSVEKRLVERSAEPVATVLDGNGPYRKAIELVEAGAGADQLIEQCGLTRAEADLLCLMHRSLSGQR